MRRARHVGFSLIELLVVIAIMSILIAMLMPAMFAVTETVSTTRCKRNLGNIFKAQNAWRANNNSTHFAIGPSWVNQLLPYLEEGTESVVDPSGPGLVGSVSGKDKSSVLRISDFSFACYEGGDAGRTSTSARKLHHIIQLDPNMDENSKYWTQKTQVGPNVWNWGVEDGGWNRDPDIEFQVTLDGSGNVIRFRLLGKTNRNDASGYRYGLLVCGQYADGFEWYQDIAISDTDIDITEYGFAYSDYGMSRGCYENKNGATPRPDPKLFLILDYPKSIANYAELGGGANNEEDSGPDYFILDPATWKAPPRFEDRTWQQVQSLRHDGYANVLFCDGHIESLPYDPETITAAEQGAFLRKDNELWRYTGR